MGKLNSKDSDVAGFEIKPCSFCGKKEPTGFWAGGDLVFCCRVCAMEILPALMADAIADMGLKYINTQGFKRIEIAFWKALCLSARPAPKV